MTLSCQLSSASSDQVSSVDISLGTAHAEHMNNVVRTTIALGCLPVSTVLVLLGRHETAERVDEFAWALEELPTPRDYGVEL